MPKAYDLSDLAAGDLQKSYNDLLDALEVAARLRKAGEARPDLEQNLQIALDRVEKFAAAFKVKLVREED